ncbi:hypothetical protein NCC49_006390 [Naganishia albida]|nr:hypothetical protein NCC49_006390 [Naganishia albida]
MQHESSPLLSSPPPTPPTKARTMSSVLTRAQRKFVTGVVLLLCVVVLWTVSNFITSDLLSGGYDKPFLITYLNTSAFSLYLVPFFYKQRKRRRDTSPEHTYTSIPREPERPAAIPSHSIGRANSLIRSASPSPALNLHNPPLPSSHVVAAPAAHERSRSRSSSHSAAAAGGRSEDKLSTRETASLAAVFCFAWFAANWSVNASLGLTSVGSSTILAGMSGFFTLGLGRLVGVESFTRAKVLAVLASFIGLLLVTHSDSTISTSSVIDEDPLSLGADRRPKNALLGDMLALLSAVCYAVYVILLKVKIGDEERVDMQLFFGFVGLFNTLFLLPFIPILHVLGVETFRLPLKRDEWIVCAINMVITLSSDYLYVLSMLKTTPLVVTIGLSLTIPFAMAGDVFRGATATITWQSLVGATLVIAGFGLMGLEGWEEGMTSHVPIDAAVVGIADEETSLFSLDSEREEVAVHASRRPAASIRG